MPDRPTPEDETSADTPHGELSIRTVAMPADANPAGDIFGGWLLSQMDVAGGIIAHRIALGRAATIAVDAMKFHQPVFVGDLVSFYTSTKRLGNTSVTVDVSVEVERGQSGGAKVHVTQAEVVYVHVDQGGRPTPIPQ